MSGSFARTLDAVRWANEIGLPVQINTTFSRRNVAEIDKIVALDGEAEDNALECFLPRPYWTWKAERFTECGGVRISLCEGIQSVKNREL